MPQPPHSLRALSAALAGLLGFVALLAVESGAFAARNEASDTVRSAAAPTVEVDVPTNATTRTPVQAAEPEATGTGPEHVAPEPEAPSLTVPDFDRMRLDDAWALADSRDLRLLVWDNWGERVHRRDARGYEVRRQVVEAGTAAEAGDAIRLRVRPRRSFFAAMGY